MSVNALLLRRVEHGTRDSGARIVTPFKPNRRGPRRMLSPLDMSTLQLNNHQYAQMSHAVTNPTAIELKVVTDIVSSRQDDSENTPSKWPSPLTIAKGD
ncbi:hypothetical protein GSI_08023 [Ganoderma sinense ZZ0214-1]|uniref:Uncharacterized protein n=1 Tax=Ganoderma sinense ZZ0214-1 TaxID=1077348 RepID=A0A2G8S7W0_9APHY|nr:hypothetical protein GSI_08023 [Ganoderma sinense ZZ0214-1]